MPTYVPQMNIGQNARATLNAPKLKALPTRMRLQRRPEALGAGRGGLPARMRPGKRPEALSAGRGGNTATNMATIRCPSASSGP
jgi:hypothetical protein